MIIDTAFDKASEFTGVKVQGFKIQANSKAFKAIAVNYSNLVKAVLVELGQNAKDSHTNAKQSKPFDVVLPTALSPQLIVRDYGTSMTHSFMLGGYKELFNSTKDNSNDQDGAWGIGRLSPFAVANSYSVNCFKDGVKRSYLVAYDAKGMPEIAFMGNAETEEEGGVEVIVNVNTEYIQKFRNEVIGAYEFYAIKPNIYIGERDGEKLVIGERKFIISKNKENGDLFWGLVGMGRSYAVMGSYSYPITPGNLIGYNSEVTDLLNSGIVIYFNIGDLDITVSRESLEYSLKTSEAIKKVALSISDSIVKDTNDEISNCEHYTQACIKWYNLTKETNKSYIPKSKIVDNWKDIKFNTYIHLPIGVRAETSTDLVVNSFSDVTFHSYLTDRSKFRETPHDAIDIHTIIEQQRFLDKLKNQLGCDLRHNNVIYYYTSTKLHPKEIRKKLFNHYQSRVFYFPSDDIKDVFLKYVGLEGLAPIDLRSLHDQNVAEIVRETSPKSEYAIAKVLNLYLSPIELKIEKDQTYYFLRVQNKKIYFTNLGPFGDREIETNIIHKICDITGVSKNNVFLVKSVHLQSRAHTKLLKNNPNILEFGKIFDILVKDDNFIEMAVMSSCVSKTLYYNYQMRSFFEEVAGIIEKFKKSHAATLHYPQNNILNEITEYFTVKNKADNSSVASILPYISQNTGVKAKISQKSTNIEARLNYLDNTFKKLKINEFFDCMNIGSYKLTNIEITNALLRFIDGVFGEFSGEIQSKNEEITLDANTQNG